ncbi:MAG: hypothetical protein ACOY9J_08160 [Pseudomonadota bacterium]
MSPERSISKERWITLGQGNNRRLVVVIHTWRDDEEYAIHEPHLATTPRREIAISARS